MGREEVYNSVATGISMLGLYMNQVIENQGLEKALDYWNKVGYIFGSGRVATLKEKYGDKTPSPEELKDVLSDDMTGFGSDFEIIIDSESVDTTIKQCAIHQGLAMTSAYPKLAPYCVPRTSADGVCKEGYKIKK